MVGHRSNINVLLESLVRDYKKATFKLQKEKQRNRAQEGTIIDLERELRGLREKQEEEQQIIMNFEQDYSVLKEEHQ